MGELPETVRADLRRYQDVTEKLRVVLVNKQQVQLQLSEVEDALKELERCGEGDATYKIIGNIMVAKSREELVRELSERKETLEIRLSSLQKQENLLKKQLSELEKKLTRKLGYEGQGQSAG